MNFVFASLFLVLAAVVEASPSRKTRICRREADIDRLYCSSACSFKHFFAVRKGRLKIGVIEVSIRCHNSYWSAAFTLLRSINSYGTPWTCLPTLCCLQQAEHGPREEEPETSIKDVDWLPLMIVVVHTYRLQTFS